MTTAVGGHPLLAATLARRGLISPETALPFLDPTLYRPSPPEDLPDLIDGGELILRAIRSGETIFVWGDFDVDGQTSTTLLVEALRNLGAKVEFHIPVRADESHGISLPGLRRALEGGAKVVLTCDTGVTAHDAIAYARSQGVDVVVSDHHDLPPSLPPANAVINPKRLAENHPLANLSGVGVAYKLAEYLYDRAGQAEAAGRHLDLVALGLVADLAILSGETRYLVQRGLEVMRRTERIGLQALAELAELNLSRATEEHIAYTIAPRLNALGRLSDANPAVEFLTTNDLSRARILAAQLEALNARRKLLTDQVFQAAQGQIERDHSLLDRPALVLWHASWPAGVIGIVASRLAEIYHRPTVLLATPPGEPARGSARSVEGVNINAAIAAQKELLLNFGGHPMAAGLSMDPANLPAFQRGLERTVAEMLGGVEYKPTLTIDEYLHLSAVDLPLVNDIERLAPFGPGNPPLVLACRDLHITGQTALGRDGEHLQLSVEDESGNSYQIIWWQAGAGGITPPLPAGRFDLAYSLRSSDYRGQEEVQIEWLDARLREDVGVEIGAAPAIQVIDYRNDPEPLRRLRELAGVSGLQVYAEADPQIEALGRDRNRLEPGQVLALWTIPPGPDVLEQACRKVRPATLVLFAVDANMDEADAFLKRLAGLCKYALHALDGKASFGSLAAASAQSLAAVKAGIAWLEAAGHIRVTVFPDGDTILIQEGDRRENPELDKAFSGLKSTLEESAAYRLYYRRAPVNALLPMAQSGEALN